MSHFFFLESSSYTDKVTNALGVAFSVTNRNVGISLTWIILRSQSVCSKSASAFPILNRTLLIILNFFRSVAALIFSCARWGRIAFLDLESWKICFLDLAWFDTLVLSHFLECLQLALLAGIFLFEIFLLYFSLDFLLILFNLHLLTKCRKLKCIN